MKELFLFLKENNLSLSTCESFTAGLFANEFSQLPGASNYFKGGFVCYTDQFKNKVLKISNRIIKKYGIVSEVIAKKMAKNTAKVTKSNICFSFTGFAPLTDNPLQGLSYIGVLYDKKIMCFKIYDNKIKTRKEYQQYAVNYALKCFKKNFVNQ